MSAGNPVSPDDAMSIGYKVIEMADRLTTMARFEPKAVASWGFTMDERRFEVRLALSDTNAGEAI